MQPILYAARHGQTDYNLRDCLLGHIDAPLIPSGIAHARHLAAWFADKGITKIYSSPLERARRTADEIALTTNAPVIIEPLLIEVNYGDIDGMPIAEAKASGIYAQRNLDRLNYRPPNGETYAELTMRLQTFLDKEKILQADKPILLVSHQGALRMLAAHLGTLPMEQAAHASFGHETILTASKDLNNQIETKIVDIAVHD